MINIGAKSRYIRSEGRKKGISAGRARLRRRDRRPRLACEAWSGSVRRRYRWRHLDTGAASRRGWSVGRVRCATTQLRPGSIS